MQVEPSLCICSSSKMPKKRVLPETPDRDAEVIALSPNSLTATDQFACEICGKSFPPRQNLQLHLHGHNRLSKQLQLQRREEELQNEMGEEEDDDDDREQEQEQRQQVEEPRRRIYVCPEPLCVHHSPSWAFGHIMAVKRHFCLKHGEKKWKCSECSKEYAVKADCKAHSETCGINENCCECGVSFSRKDGFTAHRTFCDALPAAGSSSLSSDVVSAVLPLQDRDYNCCHNKGDQKIVAICQFGGEFMQNNDGSVSYLGGEAHAMEVDQNMKFDDFRSEIAEMWNHDITISSIKYFLPSNKQTLITISNDKDLQRMVDFHRGLVTADIFVLTGGNVPCNVLLMGSNRTSKTGSVSAVANTGTSGAPSIAAMEDVGLHGSTANSQENIVTRMGQEFNSIQDFRDALRKYAAVKSFAIEFIKNERSRVTAKCKAASCPWRIHASKLAKTQKVRVRKITNIHTCVGIVRDTEHPFATRQWVMSTVRDMLCDNPQYKTIDITSDLYRDYGVSLKYHQGRRGKDIAREELQNSYLQSYNQLPWYCDRIIETNPGSHVTLTEMDDSGFRWLFISLQASRHGFEHGCRPLLFLHGTPLKYQGTLLAAASVDANDDYFPIAFAVVDKEGYDSWHWFLVELKSAISTTRTLTIVSDRNKGLKEAVPQVFKDGYHGYCLDHLTEDFKAELKGLWLLPVKDAVVNELKRAAYACRDTEFNICIDNMKSVSEDAVSWVLDSKPQNWSNAFFRGSRYDHVSSKVAELLQNWISQERDASIVKTVDMVRSKMAELISARREDSSMWSTTLTPNMEQKLQKELLNSRPLNVFSTSGIVFEVRDDLLYIVNIETWECTCRRWHITGLPCMHAIAVLNYMRRNIYGYCSRYFSVDCYRLSYSKSIYPIPDVDSLLVDRPNPAPTLSPPKTNLTDSPLAKLEPKKKQVVESQHVGNWPRPLHCSRCKSAGHNRTTCKALDE